MFICIYVECLCLLLIYLSDVYLLLMSLVCVQNEGTALHVAAFEGQTQVLRYLVKEKGGEVDARDKVTVCMY